MPIRTLIVDDEPAARERLRELCAADPALLLVGECRDGREAIAMIRKAAPELVFLDVKMRGIDGFRIIEEIGAEQMPFVVFATAFDCYALHAFDVDAVDYLLKPFDEKRFAEAMTRIRTRLADRAAQRLESRITQALESAVHDVRRETDRQPARIVAEKDQRLVFLDPDDIDCIEAQRNYVLIRVDDASYLLRCSMKRVEDMLAPGRFLRIQRSVIVNTRRIRDLERWFHGEYKVTLQNGMKFTSGRKYRQKILGYVRNQAG
ncbi:MAG TPA: LytTR family DNA-binding domain-containing protein [Gammaproteobacteria bacterium]|nr:LytTR family DNA-binding domain-containing protein [Gammaproteobacteria bacterium]